MALIFLFRRLVFAQVLLGIVAFCMAERNPAILLVAGALAALSWYVVEGPTGRPLPQWLIILGAFASIAWLLVDLFYQKGDVIVAMGHFILWLQVLLLYGKKSNREYGEILVLSLMQMIGASALSVSLISGILLFSYAGLALFTVLLFQLKITSDDVTEFNQQAATRPMLVGPPKAVAGRNHRWHFRMTAGIIGVITAAIATFIFLTFPRSGEPNQNVLDSFHTTTTGFSDQGVRLDGPPINSGTRDVVLHMRVEDRAGTRVGTASSSFLLRGSTMDFYDAQRHTFVRSDAMRQRDVVVELKDNKAQLAQLPEETFQQFVEVTLRRKAERVLFTMDAVTSVAATDLKSITFNPEDQRLALDDDKAVNVQYKLGTTPLASNDLLQRYYPQLAAVGTGRLAARRPEGENGVYNPGNQLAQWNVRADRVRQLGTQILQEAGIAPTESDERQDQKIAIALESHLRQKYGYSLANSQDTGNEDPVINFLFTTRKGHCELFAAGMVALARSLSLPARVVNGYRVSEYNRIGGYWVARQTHAHAWAEVYCRGLGWRTFDATPPDAVAGEHASDRSFLGLLREVYEHLEFAWFRRVASYDSEARTRTFTEISRTLGGGTGDAWWMVPIRLLQSLPDRFQLDTMQYSIIGFIAFAIVIGLASLAHTLYLRHRRMVALQLNRMPRAERVQMARQLRFYLEMLDLLERYGYVRPLWQSPFGFARELADANPLRFDPVVALTEIFYEIRFGYRAMDTDRFQRVKAHMSHLEDSLTTRRTAK